MFSSFYLPAEASAQAGKKKSGARKIKNVKETFLLDGERSERQRGGASVSFKKGSRIFKPRAPNEFYRGEFCSNSFRSDRIAIERIRSQKPSGQIPAPRS